MWAWVWVLSAGRIAERRVRASIGCGWQLLLMRGLRIWRWRVRGVSSRFGMGLATGKDANRDSPQATAGALQAQRNGSGCVRVWSSVRPCFPKWGRRGITHENDSTLRGLQDGFGVGETQRQPYSAGQYLKPVFCGCRARRMALAVVVSCTTQNKSIPDGVAN